MGGGSSPSPFFGGVVYFWWEPGDILTGLKGVLLVAPEAVAEVATDPGLAIPKPRMVGDGVTAFIADSVIFSSTSARNCSSIASVCIPFALPELCRDHGVAGEAAYCESEVEGDMGDTASFLPPPELCASDPIRDGREGV